MAEAAPKPGLRERKKLRTRQAIQREALRLFEERGFRETTIDDIAEAAEISPATFFNYFPTKEAVVFFDDTDPLVLEAVRSQPPELSPIRALRNGLVSVFGHLDASQEAVMRSRAALMLSVPELRAAMLTQFSEFVDELAFVIAQRAGRPADDFAIRNLAGAVLGVTMSALLEAGAGRRADMVSAMDAALAHLEAGLPV